jgi:hypothetical protein
MSLEIGKEWVGNRTLKPRVQSGDGRTGVLGQGVTGCCKAPLTHRAPFLAVYVAVPVIVTEIVHVGRALAVGPTVAVKPVQEPPAGTVCVTPPSSMLSE